MQRDGATAVQWGQARHELNVRRELDVRDTPERAIASPRQHVRHLLCQRPDHPLSDAFTTSAPATYLERYRLDIDEHTGHGARP